MWFHLLGSNNDFSGPNCIRRGCVFEQRWRDATLEVIHVFVIGATLMTEPFTETSERCGEINEGKKKVDLKDWDEMKDLYWVCATECHQRIYGHEAHRGVTSVAVYKQSWALACTCGISGGCGWQCHHKQWQSALTTSTNFSTTVFCRTELLCRNTCYLIHLEHETSLLSAERAKALICHWAIIINMGLLKKLVHAACYCHGMMWGVNCLKPGSCFMLQCQCTSPTGFKGQSFEVLHLAVQPVQH